MGELIVKNSEKKCIPITIKVVLWLSGFYMPNNPVILYINQLYHPPLHFDEGCKNLIFLKSFRRLAADIRTTRCHR